MRFNVIVRPNNWGRRASRRSGNGPLTEEQAWLRRYWTSFAEHLEEVGAAEWMRALPRDRYWGGEVGRPGFRIFGIVNRKERLLEVQLDIRHAALDSAISALEAHRSEIEAETGALLQWRRKPESFQIGIQNRDLDPADETLWRHQHEWMLARMKDFRRAFKDRIADIAIAMRADDPGCAKTP